MTITLIIVGVALIVGGLYAALKHSEEQKAAEREQVKRQELERIVRLTHDLGKRGPTGFQRRVS